MGQGKAVPPMEPPPEPATKGTNIRSRSVSLSRRTTEKKEAPDENIPKKSDAPKRKRDSPPPKDCVQNKRQIFEDQLASKYRAQRSAKENLKNKSKKDKSKKEEDDMSIASLLREMRADIKDIKSDNKEIKANMQQMNQKTITMETKQKESDENTAAELVNIRKGIEDGKEAMQ